jgi:hypothetical protein
MIVLGGLEAILGFISLAAVLRASHRTFYGVLGMNVAVRAIILVAAAYVLVKLAPSAVLPLFALVTVYFLSSLVQIPFLLRLHSWTSSKS